MAASGSVAVAVYTVPVPFSAKFVVAALVITGVSLTLVTVMATAWAAVVLVPSEAVTVMSYTLLAPLSVAASKFGAVAKVTTPLLLLMAKRAASAPPRA